ncbi:hypothetical protein, partial [Labrenzia sp. 011]|uniref:hypothetical protein n=1 Tax=Labrenzia sp. 011 TaxID=2171494 RepID=UPI00197B6940
SILAIEFRVSKGMIAEDRCANFFRGRNLTSEPQATGCTMVFEWYGPEANTNGLSISKFETDKLYHQGKWRSVLVPGSSKGLIFKTVELDDSNREELSNKRWKWHFRNNHRTRLIRKFNFYLDKEVSVLWYD